MDDECPCPQCQQMDTDYLLQFFLWVQRIDPDVIEIFDAEYDLNELSMN